MMTRSVAALAAICLLIGSQCLAQAEPMKLYFLADGNVRFDGGPELDAHRLRSEIHRLERLHPRPEIRLIATKDTSYQRIGAVLLELSRAHYGPHLGFVGNSK